MTLSAQTLLTPNRWASPKPTNLSRIGGLYQDYTRLKQIQNIRAIILVESLDLDLEQPSLHAASRHYKYRRGYHLKSDLLVSFRVPVRKKITSLCRYLWRQSLSTVVYYIYTPKRVPDLSCIISICDHRLAEYVLWL